MISVSGSCDASGSRTVTINSGVTSISHACFYNPDTCLTQDGRTCAANTTTGSGCGKDCKTHDESGGSNCGYSNSAPLNTTYTVKGGSCVHFALKNGGGSCGKYQGRLYQGGVSTNPTVADWQCGEDESAYTAGADRFCDSSASELADVSSRPSV